MEKFYFSHMVIMHIKYTIISLTLVWLWGCSTIEEPTKSRNPGKQKAVNIFTKIPFLKNPALTGYKEYFTNRKPKFESGLKHGAFHGPSQSWWVSGHLRSRGSYKNGLHHGTWLYYHDGAKKLMQKGRFHLDKKQGVWTQWDKGGAKLQEGVFESGQKTGVWRTWYPSRILKSANTCFAANDTGSYHTYYSNGNIQESYSCVKGLKTGAFLLFFPSGQVQESGLYDNLGRRSDKWIQYHDNGVKAGECFYKEGVRHGYHRTWGHDRHLITQGILNMGTGEVQTFGPQGLLQESISYMADQKHGRHMVYYPSGKTMSVTVYNHDTATSYFKWYDNKAPTTSTSSSVLARSGSFRKGKRHGKWKYYSLNGLLVELANYQDGKRQGPTYYYDTATGNLQKTVQYMDGFPAKTTLAVQ